MYEIKVYFKEDLYAKIIVDGTKVTCENYQDDVVWKPFGENDNPTLDDLNEFYEWRCFPKERVNCADILRRLNVPFYDGELICRKTHGLQFDDFIWLQFSDEPQVTWDEIKIRG